MTISIISATFNRAGTVAQAIESLHAQSHSDFEHVIIDGASRDGTLAVLEALADPRTRLLSEPDGGIYDALNKGIVRARGDVIGILHSDDFYASDQVLASVAAAFDDPDVDAVYGDLHYVTKADPSKIVRNWTSGAFTPAKLALGWMPPHPTLFLRRRVIERHGSFDTSFRIAADYDAILRYFGQTGFRATYVPEVFVKMRVGGESNRSLGRIVTKSREDYRALRKNNIGGITALLAKNVRKLGQFRTHGKV